MAVIRRSGGRARAVLLAAVLAALPGIGLAQGAAPGLPAVPPLGPLAIGSANTAYADPPVARPTTTPIRVTLFQHLRFADYIPKPFAFLPPPGAKRRWAKIVLSADYSVTAGRQFDRTAQIAIGRTNVYFGTTPEPSGKGGQSWHVERDITDYGALLQTAQPGEASLGTVVDAKYNGVFEGSASLLFYPADARNPPADVPDAVLPLADAPSGTASLSNAAQTLTRTLTLPTNVVRAYLDIITQSQGSDEFWYLNVPDSLSARLQSSGGTAFREAEISVDGRPAGVAPVYPWIYTGGIDPGLWRPLPGVQTLNLLPYRVDLTPFAGLLSNGKPHQIGVRVVNDRDFFQVAGTVLLYRDAGQRVVKGALTEDTLKADPVPVVRQNISNVNGSVSGPVRVSSARRFVTAGYVLTSAGKVTTRVVQSVGFLNVQRFNKFPSDDNQEADQTTRVRSTTVTRSRALVVKQQQDFTYPLAIYFPHHVNGDGTVSQTVFILQAYEAQERCWVNGVPFFARRVLNSVSPTDTMLSNAQGAAVGIQTRTSTQTYKYADTLGNHYQRTLAAANGVLTSITDGLPR